MLDFLEIINRIVWGIPALILILGVGLYLSIQTRFVQFRFFPKALRAFIRQISVGKRNTDGVSQYQALCTALAATVGTGNIAGVAGAIAIGGPGAIFWMWVCALFGMVTKFAEATLALRYRIRNNNTYSGGPMYMIQQGLGRKWNWLAVIYCFFGIVASFGVGNATQINAVVGGVNSVLTLIGVDSSGLLNILMGTILAIVIGIMLLGGAKRIGLVAEKLVPFAAAFYLALGFAVLIVRIEYVPRAFGEIIQGAFMPRAVTGGMLGSAFTALRVGASRGVFTNEAGMGTAAIAHSSADVSQPVQQGLMGIMEVFIDTIVICTMTALVILSSGVPIEYGIDAGVALTVQAFSAVLGNWVRVPIALSLCCFAIATVLGWGLYGMRCAQYLFGQSIWKRYVTLQCVFVVLGACLGTGTVWLLSETVNGLMAAPNLTALILLTPELVRLINDYSKSPT